MAVTLLQEVLLLFQMACVVFLFAYLFAKSRFYTQVLEHRVPPATGAFLALVFGLLSVYGMSSGISFYTATVNIRDFGPMAAGLACGPYIGLGAGIVGLLYRLAVGGSNVYAVALGPLAAGIIGGLVYQYSNRGLVTPQKAVIVTFITETLLSAFAILVRILDGESPETWMTVTVNVALPMILMTTLAVGVFCIILRNETRERKTREDKFRLEQEVESKRNLATVINTIPYPVYVLDRDHRFTMVNDSLCRFIGRTREEIIARTPRDFFSEEDSAFHWEMTEDVFRRSASREDEVTITRPDGRKCTLVSTAAIYIDVSGQVFMVGVIRDITERKKMQDALAESEAWYRTLFEHTGAATIIIHENGIIGQVNSEFAELTGYSREEIEGKMTWKHLAHPADLEMVREYHRDRLKDPAKVPTFYTVRMQNRKGETRTLHAVVAIIPGTKQSIASYVDVTEQKRFEEALTLVNKKLNLLSSITRHDILNQLMILKGFLALLRNKTVDPVLHGYVGRSENSALNIERQILFTRDYQDMGLKAPAWQDVRSLVISARGTLPLGGATVETGGPDVEVYADPLFGKVFYNLIDNSLKYGGAEMKTIRIVSEETAAGLSIVCEDDGTGIDGTDRAHLFEKGYGRHTGLGLFLSREILSITGISIEDSGTQGSGARFTIRVPRGLYRIRKDRSDGG